MSRIATPGTPSLWHGLPSREREPEFRPYGLRGERGKRGVLDDILLHPRVGAGVQSLRLELTRASIQWTPEDEADPQQVAFAEAMLRFCEQRCTTDATDPGAGWSDVLAWSVDAWVYGFALANWSWTVDARGRRVLELYPVMPSTVATWVRDSGTGEDWIAVRQATQLRTVDIPRDRLVYLRTHGAPGEWEGESILRPLIFTVETWKESSRAIVMVLAAASGIVDVTAPAGGSDSVDWSRIEDQLVEFEQGLRRWFMHEDGYRIDMKFPAAGATGGLIEVLQYCDQQIDQGLQQSLQSLGFSAHGSRALGEEIGSESREMRRASMQVLLRRLGAPIATLVAEEVGYTGPLPVMEPVTERAVEVERRVDVLGRAVQAGLIQWTPDRANELAEELGLSAIDALPAEGPAQLSAGCGCGSCSPVRLAAPRIPGWQRRELLPEEAVVDWEAAEAVRLSADGDLARDILNEAAQHRLAIWAALPDEPGAVPAEIDRVTDGYRERYAVIVGAYAMRVAEEVAIQSRGERHRQLQPDGTRSYVMAPATALERALGGRLEAAITEAARVIASRVQGRVLDHWMMGGRQDTFEADQPRLYREAFPVGNLVESEGRAVEAFAQAPADGMVPVAAIRTEVRDDNLCAVCKSRARRVFDLTTAFGLQEFIDSPLPDPDCEGGGNCRCGYVLRYRRATPEEFAAWQAELAPILFA